VRESLGERERESLGPRLRERGLVLRKRVALLVPPTRLLGRLRRRPLVKFAHAYLGGLKGIEIGGAAHNDFGVDALNVDRYASMDTVYKRAEREVWGRAKRVDMVAPGHDLPLEDKSVDFVLASHVLEHVPDPIAALLEWVRVAREYVFLVVPHRDRTFDRDRPLTPVAELIERHETGFSPEEDRHWSVWTCESFLELCDRLGLEVLEHRDPDHRHGCGFALILSARVPPRTELAGAVRLHEPSAR
jgi:SAM-dependent methyltransferase